MSKLFSSALLVVALFSSASYLGADDHSNKGPDDDGTKPALTKIAGEAFADSHAFEYLTELSDDIGSRLTGSTQDQQAQNWAVAKMKAIGLSNVHTEPYQIWRGWTRGPAQAELVSPIRRTLHIDAMGWTGSTPSGGSEAEVVTANPFALGEETKNPSRFAGKIVLLRAQGNPSISFDVLFAQIGDFLRLLAKSGAVGVVGGQAGLKSEGLNLTHTGILGFSTDFSIPVVSMTAEDQSQLERYVSSGKTVRIRLNVQNSFTAGPVSSANVVGEIPGREHPDQIFVVGAHLDSWDLSEGTTDNGMGSAAVLGAAEAIVRSGERPRRTIRFVLFTGEEQGLLGSYAYIKQHEREMDHHLGDIVLDEGQGPIKELQLGGRDDLLPAFRPFAQYLSRIHPVTVNEHVEFGTDTGPFIVAGLPGINANQNSPDYRYTHHSSADALEAVKPETLVQDTALIALTAFWIADRPDRLASPWPAKRTAKMLRVQRQYDFLKAFDLWTFGDLGSEPDSSQPDPAN